MTYHIIPNGEYWKDGIFCVPVSLIEKSLKFSNELQLKALLILLSRSGTADEKAVAEALGCSEQAAAECLDYWCYEGFITKDGEEFKPKTEAPEEPETQKKAAFESLPVPNLTPSDIVNICFDNPELKDLLRTAERILGTSLSNAFKSNLVNMVTYYGLPASVVVTLLEYYKAERDAGRNITTRKLQNIAREWAGEEVSSIEEASKKLLEMTEIDALWLKVLDLCGFEYRQPTSAQKKMLSRWRTDFSDEMIAFACNTMKKYTDEDRQSVKAVDNVLKDWKRKKFTTPDEVKAQPEKEKKKPAGKGKLKTKPSFDIEEIKKRSALNDDFDI